ncbi:MULTISPECIES: glycosyltransferase family 4 protein [Bradyrhizobium]|uniref:glycosyltransferase family 4 protein n=1 Tax=Bradyrhizobium TaxID=374 RepID=UPI000C1DDC36|nr:MULTISPECIES: glycosyltransferase family 4 protein [Bradyrhizobium]
MAIEASSALLEAVEPKPRTPTPRKVLIWHWGRRGGGVRYTYELVRELRKRPELELHLSLSRQGEIVADFDALGLPGYHVDTYTNVSSAILALLRVPIVRRRFWRYIQKHNISVVVCTMSHLWNVPVLWRRPRDVAYVFVLHDPKPHAGDDIAIRKWMLDTEIAASDGIVALTEYTQKSVTTNNSFPTERVWTAPLGVFPYAETRSPAPMPTGRKIQLLFFGRLLPYKGLDILLDAYKIMKREGKDVGLRIIGPGDIEPYRAQIAGLEDVFVDNRWIPEEDVGAAFEGIDIVVAPYRGASQSAVLATSGAAGIPAVVTPVGGLAEQVLHEQTGLVAADATPAALAAALGRLVDDEALRLRYGAAAKVHAMSELSWSAIAAKFASILTSITPRQKSETQ